MRNGGSRGRGGWVFLGVAVLIGALAVALGPGLVGGSARDEPGIAQERPRMSGPPSLDKPPSVDKPPAASEPGSAVESAGCVPPPGGGSLEDQDMRDFQVPWERAGLDKVTIYFEAGSVTQEYRRYMDEGARVWNRSPCLDVRVVHRCPGGANCVTTSLTKGNAADGNFDSVERNGFTVAGHIDLYVEPLQRQGDGAKLNVTIHEMGHGVGLRHRKAERVLMNGETYTDVFEPDETDYRNLLRLYGSQGNGSQE